MKVKMWIKAGGIPMQHNETLVRAPSQAKSLKVKTRLKAGGIRGGEMQHNETLVKGTPHKRACA
jgi:hypothetical protein